MMVKLIFYARFVVQMRPDAIERATYEDEPCRFLAGEQHPDHNAIRDFVARHETALSELHHQMWNRYEKAYAKAFKELREQEESSRRRWWDGARGELLRRERKQGSDTAVLKSLWRRDRRAARKMTRRRLASQLQAEDEGPLPEEARNYILETPRVLLLALSSLNQSNLLKVMVDLAPAFVVNALWDFHRLSFDKPPGGVEAMVRAGYLIERVCDFVHERDELHTPRRRKRGPGDPRIPTKADFHDRFKSDAPIVEALWPCVRFLVAYKNAPPGARFALRAELGSLTRLLASIHLPSDWNAESSLRAAADTRKRVSERAEKEQARDQLDLKLEEASAPTLLALVTHGSSPNASARADLERILGVKMRRIANMKLESSDKRAILSYVADIRDKVLCTYVPKGKSSKPLRYVAKSLKNKMLDEPVRVPGKDVSEPGSQEAIGSEQTEIAASSYRKHRKRLGSLGSQSAATRDIANSIELGRERQRHHDPEGEWLAVRQCAVRLMQLYDVSEGSVFNHYRAAVLKGEIVSRGPGGGAGTVPNGSFAILEQRIKDNFQPLGESRLLLKKALPPLEKQYRGVTKDVVRQALERLWALDEEASDMRHDAALDEKARLKTIEKAQSKALQRWARSTFSPK